MHRLMPQEQSIQPFGEKRGPARGGSGWLDRMCLFLCGASRCSAYEAVCSAGRRSTYTPSGVWPSSTRRGLVVDRRARHPENLTLPNDGQGMRMVDHRFALSKPALMSAPSKQLVRHQLVASVKPDDHFAQGPNLRAPLSVHASN